jgi:hypothetical protein
MKKNEKGLDIDKTKPNLGKDEKDSKRMITDNKNIVINNQKPTENKVKDPKLENPVNKLEKAEKSPDKKEVQIVKDPSSPKLEKISEDRKSSNSNSNDNKIESGSNFNSQPNNNLLKLPLRKFQLDVSEMIEKPQEKLIPKK